MVRLDPLNMSSPLDLKRGVLGFIAALVLTSVVSNAQAGIGMLAPDIVSPVWLNSEPQRLSDLRGRVVLVEFWTFGCYNCRNVEPYVKAWHHKYMSQGLTVIGVHSPEFKYERDLEQVKHHLHEHEIQYAIAIDNDFATWNRYKNHYWPAMYLIDKHGILRYIRIGEGGYDETEHRIRLLLAEN